MKKKRRLKQQNERYFCIERWIHGLVIVFLILFILHKSGGLLIEMKSPTIDYNTYSDNIFNYSYIEVKNNLSQLWITEFEKVDPKFKIGLNEIIIDDRIIYKVDGVYRDDKIHIFVYTSIPIKEMVYHEIGHNVWHNIKNDTLKKFWKKDYDQRMSQCVEEYNIFKCYLDKDRIYSGRFFITYYSSKNNEEYFAEAFAHYFICKDAVTFDRGSEKGKGIQCDKPIDSCVLYDYTEQCNFFEENPKINQAINDILEETK